MHNIKVANPETKYQSEAITGRYKIVIGMLTTDDKE